MCDKGSAASLSTSVTFSLRRARVGSQSMSGIGRAQSANISVARD
jgi:hypothetical protein